MGRHQPAVKRRRGERGTRLGGEVLDSHGEAIYRDHVGAYKYPTDNWWTVVGFLHDARKYGHNGGMNHGRTETWRERLIALEWRPDTVLVMARLFHQLAKDLTPAQLTQLGARLQSDTFKTAD